MPVRRAASLPVVVVGAGMAGLVCAADLAGHGHTVVVVDKGRGVGGRMATRRLGAAVADHGAQYFTARSPEFSAMVDGWVRAGVVTPWFTDGSDVAWRGAPSMTAVAKHLAAGRDVRLGWTVTAVAAVCDGTAGHWQVRADTGDGPALVDAAAVVVTAPVPQAQALLAAGGVVATGEAATRLAAVDYEPCIAVLVVPAADRPGDAVVPAPGWRRGDGGPVAWVADNHAKGVSPVPSFTVHVGAAASAALLDADDAAVLEAIAADPVAAGLALGSPDTQLQVVRWRYARVSRPDAGGPVVVATAASGPVVVAGDAFAGPRVEAAALSGLAASGLIAQR
jgi:renalase